jgi:ketosteroid isomerase-like protein
MSQQHLNCLRRAIELGNAGDLEGLAALYHADAELRELNPPPDFPEVIRGREAVLASWERWLEALGAWNVEVCEYIDADPWVVCDMRWRAAGKGSAAPAEWRDAGAFEVEDGLIVRQILGFADAPTALRAIADAA